MVKSKYDLFHTFRVSSFGSHTFCRLRSRFNEASSTYVTGLWAFSFAPLASPRRALAPPSLVANPPLLVPQALVRYARDDVLSNAAMDNLSQGAAGSATG